MCLSLRFERSWWPPRPNVTQIKLAAEIKGKWWIRLQNENNLKTLTIHLEKKTIRTSRLIVGWNSVTRKVSLKWDLQNCLWSEGTCQGHKWPQLSATDLQREELGSSPLTVRSLGRPFPHCAEIQKDYNFKTNATRSHPASPQKKPLETSQRVVSVILKEKEREREREQKSRETAILGDMQSQTALLEIRTSFYTAWMLSHWVSNLGPCSKVFWLIAHLRRKHVKLRPQSTHTDNFSIETTRKEKVWRKRNPLTLLVGMQSSTATMENSVEIP